MWVRIPLGALDTAVSGRSDDDLVYGSGIRAKSGALRAQGLTWSQISRLLGVSRSTLRDWQASGRLGPQPIDCPRCDGRDLDPLAYAALLGFYLGDGCISALARYYSLRVVSDATMPGLIDDITACIRAVRSDARIFHVTAPGAVVVASNWNHRPCLFPQHGAGRKHERPIVLDDWQRAIVEDHPGPFLRGLFHSDGCRVKNWTMRPVAGEMKRYEYPRWQFSNTSTDIRELVLLGARPRRHPVAPEQLELHQCLQARRRGGSRRSHRAEDLRRTLGACEDWSVAWSPRSHSPPAATAASPLPHATWPRWRSRGRPPACPSRPAPPGGPCCGTSPGATARGTRWAASSSPRPWAATRTPRAGPRGGRAPTAARGPAARWPRRTTSPRGQCCSPSAATATTSQRSEPGQVGRTATRAPAAGT